MSGGSAVRITAFTHQGRVRDTNEDTVVVGSWTRNIPMREPWRCEREPGPPTVCLVADGMGGHAAGEVASRYVARRIVEEGPYLRSSDDVTALLQRINFGLYEEMAHDRDRLGMGSTAAGLLFVEDRLLWFNVGDSRIYRYRNGFLRQISVDDTLGQDKREYGGRASRALTQALGGGTNFRLVEPHVSEEALPVPSRYLLCSDGLTDMVGIDDMEACMGAPDPEAVRALFDAAMWAGGEDNLSILVVSVGQQDAGEATPDGEAGDGAGHMAG